MTLDAAEVAQITRIAQAVAAEAIRNLARGTGGANIPIPATHPGTVGGDANAGDETLVRVDGDFVAVPAVNATGAALGTGDRVLISWLPPHGVYVTHQLRGSARGQWFPAFSGPGVGNSATESYGFYTRENRQVHVVGRAILHAPGTWGTGLSIVGLPFPVRTNLRGVPSVGNGYVTDASAGQSFPVTWVIGEGATGGTVFSPANLGGINEPLGAITTTFPFAQADGDYVTVDLTYDVD